HSASHEERTTAASACSRTPRDRSAARDADDFAVLRTDRWVRLHRDEDLDLFHAVEARRGHTTRQRIRVVVVHSAFHRELCRCCVTGAGYGVERGREWAWF